MVWRALRFNLATGWASFEILRPMSRVLSRLDKPNLWGSIAISAIIIGAALRLLGCVLQGQFYVDDARLALNIASRSLSDLTRPLDYGQVAPIPFLWLQKWMTQVGGVNENALRVLPLVASIAVLFLVWSVGRRAFGERPATVAVCLGALSTFLIGFAAAPKQYSSDALVTLLVVWLVLDVFHASRNDAVWRRLGIGGAAALWMSHPAVFVRAAAALALPISTEVRAVPGWWRRYALTMIGWATMFGVLYVLAYQSGERDPYLREYWGWTFLSPTEPDLGGRVWRALRAILVPPVWRGGTLLGTPLALAVPPALDSSSDLRPCPEQRIPHAALCVGLTSRCRAAVVGQYPPGSFLLLRPALFSYASAVAWAACALPPQGRVRPWRGTRRFTSGYPAALEQASNPERKRETAALLRTVDARAPEAPIYLFTSGARHDGSVWAFYTTDWNAPDTARLRRFASRWTRDVASTFSGGVAPTDAEVLPSKVGRHQELVGTGARIHALRAKGSHGPRHPTRDGSKVRAIASGVRQIPLPGCGLPNSIQKTQLRPCCTASGSGEAG